MPAGRRLGAALFAVLVWVAGAAGATPQLVPASGYVVARDGTHLYYEIAGSGPRTVVVSGGFLLRQSLEPLTHTARVVFYDARGRGRSDPADPDRVSLQHQVDDLEDLRAALGLERMVLFAWSGMGKELFAYVLAYPQRVERMIQVGAIPPGGDFFGEMMETRAARADPDALAELRRKREAGHWADDPAGYCRAEAAVANVMTFADPGNVSAYPDVCVWPNEWPANLAVLFGALLPSVQAFDPRPQLAQNEVPRLVIHGAEDAIPLAGARLWVEGAPAACLLVLPAAAHWPFVEARGPFFDAVNAFLRDGSCPAD